MQPENNAQGNAAPVTNAALEVTPVAAPEAAPMATETPRNDNMFENTPKKSNGMLIGLILCLILAIGGIGFGVWAMMDGESQKGELNDQIAVLKKQNNELLDKLGNTSDGGGVVNNVDTADYIYVGEWGLKIKIPDGLAISGYDFNAAYNSHWAGVTNMLAIWGTKMGGGQYFPDFADSTKNEEGLGMVIRYAKGTELNPESSPSFLFSDDEYDYYYKPSVGVYSMDEDEQRWESESGDLVYEMISDKDNYSKI